MTFRINSCSVRMCRLLKRSDNDENSDRMYDSRSPISARMSVNIEQSSRNDAQSESEEDAT